MKIHLIDGQIENPFILSDKNKTKIDDFNFIPLNHIDKLYKKAVIIENANKLNATNGKDIGLKQVFIGKTITELLPHCFENSSNLVSVEIENSVLSIDNDCFKNCISLSSIKMTDKIELIGENAFANCKEIPSLTLGSHLSTINDNAFNGCSNLISLDYCNDLIAEEWNSKDLSNVMIPRLTSEHAFDGMNENWFIKVPPYMYWNFVYGDIWRKFSNSKWTLNDYPPNGKTHIITTFIPEDYYNSKFNVEIDSRFTYLVTKENTNVTIDKIENNDLIDNESIRVSVLEIKTPDNIIK